MTTKKVIEYERPFLYEKQEGAFFNEKRYSFVEASTKAGKTHACIVWIVEMAVVGGFAGWNGWWVAPTKAQALIAMRRIKNAVPREFYRANDSDAWIELPNGARIWFKSAEKADNLYGEDVYAAVFDEASRARYDAFLALRSTLTATRGPLRLIANVKGKSNWFYQRCRAIERQIAAGEPIDSTFTRITCHDAVAAGLLEAAEIDDARRVLPASDFQELYEAIASDDDEAFLPSEYVEKAIARGRAGTVEGHGVLIIGGDPSQGRGDPAAFCHRKGSKVLSIEEFKDMDEFGFIAHAIRLIDAARARGEDVRFFMDGTGFGTTIAKVLKEKGYGEGVVKAFHMAERSTYPEEYYNKRAECWGEGRKDLINPDQPYSLPDHDGFAIELTCIRKKPNTRGTLLLEAKEDLAARGYPSPNMGDAWALTYAEPVAFYMSEQITYTPQRRNRNLA